MSLRDGDRERHLSQRLMEWRDRPRLAGGGWQMCSRESLLRVCGASPGSCAASASTASGVRRVHNLCVMIEESTDTYGGLAVARCVHVQVHRCGPGVVTSVWLKFAGVCRHKCAPTPSPQPHPQPAGHAPARPITHQ